MRRSIPARGAVLLGAALALGVTAALSGCAPSAPAATAPDRLIVHVAPARHVERYDVQIHRQQGQLITTHSIRSGETRVYAAPAGWITIRIPGVCVLPTPHVHDVTVRVTATDCTLD